MKERLKLTFSPLETSRFPTSPLQVLMAAVPRTPGASTVPRRWQEFPSGRRCSVLLALPFLLSRM